MVLVGGFRRNKYRFSTKSVMIEVGEEINKVREQQMALIIDELYSYGVFLKDLVGHTPSYLNRNIILNVAYYIIEEYELYEYIKTNKVLPYNKLSKRTKLSRGFLENWQDYILAYLLILSNPNYKYIQEYVNVELNEQSKEIVPFKEKEDSNIHRGIVIKVEKKSIIIMTSSGEFLRIKKDGYVQVGSSVHGHIKKGLKDYKFHIAIGCIILLLLSFIAYKDYNNVYSTIILSGTSQIKLEINRGNKVVYEHVSTEKAQKLIDVVQPLDKDIDTVIKDCIEYANENDMIPKDGLVITISGKALGYGVLDKTGDYIVDNNIQVKVNNAGNVHNIYESVKIKRRENNTEE